MTRFASTLAFAVVLSGCTKANSNGTAAPVDPITRFVAGYTNIQVSTVYQSFGAPSSMTAEQALAKLSINGVRMPIITNLKVIEMRALKPEEPHLARRLTNCVAALVESEVGQKIILLKEISAEWCYHVYDSK
jgi:hypothetical protein